MKKSFTCDPRPPRPMNIKQRLEAVAEREKNRHADAPKINVYVCQDCKQSVVTEDVHAGVTPMFIDCRATENCGGSMVSGMYQVPQDLTATFEWYRPKNLRAVHDEETRSHILQGGLLLRRKEGEI